MKYTKVTASCTVPMLISINVIYGKIIIVLLLVNQSINQHHKNLKIPSPGGRSVYTNMTDSVLSLSV